MLAVFARYEELGRHLDDLDTIILESQQELNSLKQMKEKIKLVVDEHVEVFKFLKLFEEVFGSYFMIEMGSLVFQTTVSLYACLKVRR